MDIKKEIEDLAQEVIDLRRDFHMHPELGFEEFRTSEIIVNYLKNCGIQVQKMAKTGVIGLLRGGKPGRTVLLRADMDALPVQEENDVPYKSIYEGKMHACAHDAHVAMLLGAAKILAKHKDEIKGNIKFVFQPNEEEAGAKFMVEEGALENPEVDASFGIHLWAPLESGKIGLAPGPVMAEHYNFQLVIKGKGGHTSAPQSSIDPIITAANVIQTVQTIQTREINALNPTVIVFGKISGGSAPNIIPEKVELEGTIRYLYDGSDQSEEKPKVRFERIIKGICEAHRTEYALDFIPSNLIVINDDELTSFLKEEAAEKIVKHKEDIVSYVCLGGEDFSEFSNVNGIPGVLTFIGTGNPDKESNYPHHHPRFNIDEDTLAIGVEMHIRTALSYLNKY